MTLFMFFNLSDRREADSDSRLQSCPECPPSYRLLSVVLPSSWALESAALHIELVSPREE